MHTERSENLDLLYVRLKRLAGPQQRRDYRVPAMWNHWSFRGAHSLRRGEISVDPYSFLLSRFDHVILPARDGRKLAGRSLSRIRKDEPHASGGDWLRRASIYSMLVRTTTAWDHDANGSLDPNPRWTETGTFLKSILILPHLAEMGIDTIYLLPVTRISNAFHKGEVGCPYSARSFFELDPELHDRLLDGRPAAGLPAISLETQFAAFIEAAHAMGIRVMVDLAPRTASRDSDLILEHPDWFYWIDAAAAKDYGPPFVKGCKPCIPTASQLAVILRTRVVREHIARFRHAPSFTASKRWRQFVATCRANPPRDLSAAIADEFGVITPPGFSDCLNDPQPPWTDVTFLRLYLDHPRVSVKHLDDPDNQPPYVFTDTIKASLFPGRRPNRPLWRLLAGILPFHQRFGVDGVRVDMGHALPPALQQMIIREPRRRDPDFGFLAEELNYAGGPAARRAGYSAFIGSSWYMQPRCREGELRRFVHDILPKSPLPALAAAETPDTPRAATRPGGRRFARMIAVLNHFLPSAIPFLNSGMELFERQPLNLGLDMQPPGRFALPRSDPYYGKLGYFDRVALHWRNAGVRQMTDLLASAAAIRRRFLADLIKPRNYFAPTVTGDGGRIIAVAWRVGRPRRTLLVVANTDFRGTRRCGFKGLPTGPRRQREAEVLLTTSTKAACLSSFGGRLKASLGPGDAIVALL